MQSVDAQGPPSNSSNSFTTPPPYTTPLGYPQNQLEMESPKVLAHNKHSKSLQSSPKAQFAHLLLPSVGSAADQSATAPTSPLATTKATQGVAGGCAGRCSLRSLRPDEHRHLTQVPARRNFPGQVPLWATFSGLSIKRNVPGTSLRHRSTQAGENFNRSKIGMAKGHWLGQDWNGRW